MAAAATLRLECWQVPRMVAVVDRWKRHKDRKLKVVAKAMRVKY